MLGRIPRRATLSLLSLLLILLNPFCALAGQGGTISGTIRDPTGAVIPGAVVTIRNVETGIRQTTTSNQDGFYSLPSLPIGDYDIAVRHVGFTALRQRGLVLRVGSALRLDVKLKLGARKEMVTVGNRGPHVETTTTQMGEVIAGKTITSVPLNGRSFTDLLSLQPGVAPVTSLTSNTQQDVGVSPLSPSGELNPGTISINGQREFANGFILNGSDVEEDVNSGTAVIPNLDSIAEFRILTSSFDAEYGGYSGGQIDVVTKSGTNEFHGDFFDFLRNTGLDARNYFSATRAKFDQNQFGGTSGGPIKRNKAFFFADYQGTRMTEGIDTGLIPVPSFKDRAGDLSDLANSLTGTINGQSWARLLSQELGYAVYPGEHYYTRGCGTPSACVFPGAQIPDRAWSVPSKRLLEYIPQPNTAADAFSTSSENELLRDDKAAYRFDDNTRLGLLSVYYFIDDYTVNNPYPVAQSGASVPGFNALYPGRAQLLSLGDTKTLGATAVNEFHLSAMRDYNDLGKPVGGVGVSLASQGFLTGVGTPGIVPLNPQGEGVENIVFNDFSIGTNANELKQANNTFQWTDSFSKVAGRHTMKFGADFHLDQVNSNPIAQFNGNFLFTGSETGSDFADFLLGIPSQYNQSQLNAFYGKNKYAGLFAQDSWRARANLTLNFGLRWDRIEPWYEKNNGISTFEPGKQSVVFPGAPPGILFPTDPGVPRTLAPPGNLDFGPRIGLAFSPRAKQGSVLGKILGGPDKTSIRTSFGTYYTDIEALSIGILAGNAPFGITYTSPAPPLFATPFITASNGQNQGQPFPMALVTGMASSNHPNRDVNWQPFEPISGIPGYSTTNRIPYTDEYMLSLERQFGANTVLGASYVGSQGHRLLVMLEANPGNPELCLRLSQPQDVAPGSPTCAPFGENNIFTAASGQVIHGTRGPLGSHFGSVTKQSTIGNSYYSALELSLRHVTGPLELSLGYTYSKSMDDSSNLGEEVNPISHSLSYALSSFDMRHNFVASYTYNLPVSKVFRRRNWWTQDWKISGITHFSTGFPVTLVNYGDDSLLGAEPNGINNYGVDEPDFTPGPLNLNLNPRSGLPYFNTGLFSENALGTPGTASRRFFSGPGINNFDVAIEKKLGLSESKSIEIRVEAFNVFNHAQFYGAGAVDGNISSPGFGEVVSAAAPRILQVAAKFHF
jgi:Carboxypeptidase regulatory-like domain